MVEFVLSIRRGVIRSKSFECCCDDDDQLLYGTYCTSMFMHAMIDTEEMNGIRIWCNCMERRTNSTFSKRNINDSIAFFLSVGDINWCEALSITNNGGGEWKTIGGGGRG